jgi:hypothetical protein
MVTIDFCNAVLIFNEQYVRARKITKKENFYQFELAVGKQSFYLVMDTKNRFFSFFEDEACKKRPLARYEGELLYAPDDRAYFEYIVSWMAEYKSFGTLYNSIVKRKKYEKEMKEKQTILSGK